MRSASAAASVLFALASGAETSGAGDLRDLVTRGPGRIELAVEYPPDGETVNRSACGVFVAGQRAALCRCGESRNQPFCDLAHKNSGFKDYPRVPEPTRERAECPADIDPFSPPVA